MDTNHHLGIAILPIYIRVHISTKKGKRSSGEVARHAKTQEMGRCLLQRSIQPRTFTHDSLILSLTSALDNPQLETNGARVKEKRQERLVTYLYAMRNRLRNVRLNWRELVHRHTLRLLVRTPQIVLCASHATIKADGCPSVANIALSEGFLMQPRSFPSLSSAGYTARCSSSEAVEDTVHKWKRVTS